jgi:hypothetical protein
VVFLAGSNDNLGLRSAEGGGVLGSPGWMAEYRRRVARVMDAVGRRGARLYYVGLPVMRDRGRDAAAAAVNSAILAEAADRPWVRYIDSGALLGEPGEGYDAYRTSPDGDQVKARQDDGIHMSREGTNWVADVVARAIRDDWHIGASQARQPIAGPPIP